MMVLYSLIYNPDRRRCVLDANHKVPLDDKNCWGQKRRLHPTHDKMHIRFWAITLYTKVKFVLACAIPKSMP